MFTFERGKYTPTANASEEIPHSSSTAAIETPRSTSARARLRKMAIEMTAMGMLALTVTPTLRTGHIRARAKKDA
jgi:hypothetical protein